MVMVVITVEHIISYLHLSTTNIGESNDGDECIAEWHVDWLG
jgi:hypothetical protein